MAHAWIQIPVLYMQIPDTSWALLYTQNYYYSSHIYVLNMNCDIHSK